MSLHRVTGGPTAESRRIGQRLRTAELSLVWEVPRPRPRLSFMPRKTMLQDAKVVNLSVTGAGLLAPPNDGLRVGIRVTVKIGGAIGVVQIRRMGATYDEGLVYYGVRFVVLPADFSRIVYDMLGSERQTFDDRWLTAR
jgi:hypothetical protein